ncbi:nucleoside hydrolase [Devosia sp. A449]
MKNVIIDCDPGTDDAGAIILAFKSGKLDVKAITGVSGNVTSDVASKNARRVLDLIGAPPIPVAKGPANPIMRPHPRDPFSHGEDGLANNWFPESDRPELDITAAELIVETVRKYPGNISILVLGPFTNVATALLAAPDLKDKISEIICTAGSFGFNDYSQFLGTGDNPMSEWNVFVDPEAAQLVFSSGIKVTAIGVDVWGRPEAIHRAKDLDKLRASPKPEAQFVLSVAEFVHGRGYEDSTVLIDSLVVAAAIDPTFLRCHHVHVAVETGHSPLTRGMTIIDRRTHHTWTHLPQIYAAYDADYERFLDYHTDTMIQ